MKLQLVLPISAIAMEYQACTTVLLYNIKQQGGSWQIYSRMFYLYDCVLLISKYNIIQRCIN